MALGKKVEEVEEVVEVVDSNRFDQAIHNELQSELDDLKDEYKAARKKCTNQAECNRVMLMYKESLIDLSVEAQMTQDYALQGVINMLINSLERRTRRPSYRRY